VRRLPPIALAAAAFLLYLASLPARLLAWDPIQLALGLERFDLAVHQPHPPGYLGPMALAWVAEQLGAAPGLAVQLAGALAGAAAVAATWALGRRLYGPAVATVAALLLLTNPLAWHQASSGETYPMEAAAGCVVVLLAMRVGRGSSPRAVAALFLALGLAGGIRQNVPLFLAPLAAWRLAVACAGAGWRGAALRVATAAGAGVAGVLAWGVPLAFLAGGVGPLAAAFGTQFFRLFGAAYSPLMGAPAGMVWRNLDGLWRFAAGALGPAAIVAALLAPLSVRRSRPDPSRVALYAAWIVPPLAWFVLMFAAKPGHVLALVPAFCLVEAAVVLRALESSATVLRGAVVATVVASQAALFLAPPSAWSTAVSMSSLPSLEYDEARADGVIARVRDLAAGDPSSVVAVATWGGIGFRTAMYHLPEVRVLWLVDADTTGAPRRGVDVCSALEHRVTCGTGGFWSSWDLPATATVRLEPGVKRLAWLGEDASASMRLLPAAAAAAGLAVHDVPAGPYDTLHVVELPDGPVSLRVGSYTFAR
jgi:hypothetical protein